MAVRATSSDSSRSIAEPADESYRLLDRGTPFDLESVNAASPIDGDIAFYFERSPDFFAWPDSVFDDYRYAGAFVDDRLAGYAMFGLRSAWTGSGWGATFCVGDARVLPAYRGRKLAEKLMLYLEQNGKRDIPMGFMLIKRGNRPALVTAERTQPAQHRIRRLCSLTTVNIPVLPRLRRRHEFPVRQANEADCDAIAGLLSNEYRGRLFAPCIDAALLRRRWAEWPGFEPGSYLLAEAKGKIVGVLGLWDLSAVRRTRIIRFSARANLLRAIHRGFVSVSNRGSPLPGAGGILRARTVTDIAVKDRNPALLHDLLNAAVRQSLDLGHHLIHVAFADSDPLKAVACTGLHQRFASDVFLIHRSDHPARPMESHRPPYFDLAAI